MDFGARLRAREPGRGAALVGDRGLDRDRELEGGPREIARGRMKERGVELARVRFEHSGVDLDAFGAQDRAAAPRCLRGIGDCEHDALHAGGENRVRAGRRLAVVAAGLERDVQRCSSRPLAGCPKGDDLRVRLAEARVNALAHDLTFANDDGADHRVRRRLSPSFCCQVESAAHDRNCVMRRGYFRH